MNAGETQKIAIGNLKDTTHAFGRHAAEEASKGQWKKSAYIRGPYLSTWLGFIIDSQSMAWATSQNGVTIIG